jgi:hypothetical protein
MAFSVRQLRRAFTIRQPILWQTQIDVGSQSLCSLMGTFVACGSSLVPSMVATFPKQLFTTVGMASRFLMAEP